MATLAVTTDIKESMNVYYLSEKIWAEKTGNFFLLINLVFKAMKEFDSFFIIFHGKPINPRISPLFDKGCPIKQNVVIATELSKNPLYLEKEQWWDGWEIKGANKVRIECVDNINLVQADEIELKWDQGYKECSVLTVSSKKFKKGQFYGVRFGILIQPPSKVPFLFLRSKISCNLHYGTFSSVDLEDRAKIASRWHEKFARIFLRNPDVDGEHFTSTLMFYLPPRQRIIFPPTAGTILRTFRPLSPDKLSPPWLRYKWSGRDAWQGQSEIIPKITVVPEREEKPPLEITIERYDVRKVPLYLSIFLAFVAIFWIPLKDFTGASILSIFATLISNLFIEEVLGRVVKVK